MAQIPEGPPLATLAGYRPSTDAVTPTDFGLSGVAQDMGEIATRRQAVQQLEAKAQVKVDRDAAQPAFLKLQGENEAAFAAEAAAYTGDHPGFAADQIAKTQKRVQDALSDPTLSPGVKAQLAELGHGEIARVGQAANAHEAKVRAQPILDQVRAQEETVLNGGKTTFLTTYLPEKQKLLDGYDGSQAGLASAVGDAFDAAAAPALAATPDRLRPALQTHLAAMRAQEMAEASVTEAKGADAFVLTNSNDQANALINTISSNPLAFDNVVRQGLPGIVEALPAGLKKDALTEYTGLAAVARVKGLIGQGQAGQAAAELKDGRYDGFLKPSVKESLEAEVDAAQRSHGPKSFDEWMAAGDLESRANAETYARMTQGHSTGQVDLDAIAAQLGPQAAAKYATEWRDADRTYAATGAVHDMPAGDLHALAARPAPDAADPDYAGKVTTWKLQTEAAQAELKARDNPGAWAYAISPKPKGASAGGAGQAQDRGARLQQTWHDYLQATPGVARFQVGAKVAGQALGVQAAAGIPVSAWQVIPQTEAERLASSVINAPPEGRLQAMTSLAGLIHDLPASFRLPDGTTAGPQAVLTNQLLAAHLSPADVAAMADFGDSPAKMGRYVAALNDPTLKAALPGGQEATLKAQVAAQIRPFLDSVAPLPGAQVLAQARIDRTVLVARGLMAHQGMNPGTAAAQAAKDMTEGYQFVNGWRIPAAVAGGHEFFGRAFFSGADFAQAGAARLLASLTGNGGANLYAPSGPGGPDDRRKLYALQVSHGGKWVTAPDDGGLVLMAPHPDGTWDQVADRYGRPVRATWGQLTAQAKGGASPFDTPPPTVLRTPEGHPIPAASKQSGFSALAWAVNGRESGFRSGLVSGEGALGQMQVTPDTVKTYAPRLGLPVDLDRARHDDDYNRRIGQAALQDAVQRYGTGPGLGLALVAYNAGPGRLEGYRDDAHVWHPGWLQTIGDPRSGKISLTDFVARIPYKETREYVQGVLPVALKRLQTSH